MNVRLCSAAVVAAALSVSSATATCYPAPGSTSAATVYCAEGLAPLMRTVGEHVTPPLHAPLQLATASTVPQRPQMRSSPMPRFQPAPGERSHR